MTVTKTTEVTKYLTLKSVGSVITGVVAILGAFWALDNHYASAADVQTLQRSIETQVRALRQERIEDELFKLDTKKEVQGGKLSPEDAALRARYIRRLKMTEEEVIKEEKK